MKPGQSMPRNLRTGSDDFDCCFFLGISNARLTGYSRQADTKLETLWNWRRPVVLRFLRAIKHYIEKQTALRANVFLANKTRQPVPQENGFSRPPKSAAN
jgi:hypothetical protein